MRFRFMTMEQTFAYISRHQNWGSSETVSGHGSTLASTESLRAELPEVLEKLEVRVLLDIPCGDFNWMNAVEIDLDRYIGADVVTALILANRRRFGDSKRQFVRLDITRDLLPRADATFCRDCLVHFSIRDIWRALHNVRRSEVKYFISTTFPRVSKNLDIVTGDWRPLNLEAPPFRFPEPARRIRDGVTAPGSGEKCLGVWRTHDLPATPAGS